MVAKGLASRFAQGPFKSYRTQSLGTARDIVPVANWPFRKQGLNPADFPYVYLLTSPRFLNYAFNPASFWYLYTADMSLKYVIAEVNNTFDERRMYLFPGSGSPGVFRQTLGKDFHVSPFNSRKGAYTLSTLDPANEGEISVAITLRSSKGRPKLVARWWSVAPAMDPRMPSTTQALWLLTCWGSSILTTCRGIPHWPLAPLAIVLARVHKLEIWYRPEPSPSALPRRPTATENFLQSVFVQYMEYLVGTAPDKHRLLTRREGQDGGKSCSNGYSLLHLRLVQQPSREVLSLRVHTPQFYRQLITYGTLSDYLSYTLLHPYEENHTAWSSDAQALIHAIQNCESATSRRVPRQRPHIQEVLVKILCAISRQVRTQTQASSRLQRAAPMDAPAAYPKTNISMFGGPGWLRELKLPCYRVLTRGRDPSTSQPSTPRATSYVGRTPPGTMAKPEYASSHTERQIAVPSLQAHRNVDEDEVYSLQEQKRIIRRILVTVLACLYVISLVDRVNISTAALAHLNSDLALQTGARYSIVISAFFITYTLFQPLGTVLTRKIGPRLFLSSIAMAWGLVMIGNGFVDSWQTLAGLRVLVGVFEAGYFPGAVYLLSTWYTRFDMQKRYTVFYGVGVFEAGYFPGAVYLLSTWYTRFDMQKRYTVFYGVGCVAGALGGILAFGLSQMNGLAGLRGWRWIFIIEGVLSCVGALASYVFLVGFPEEADQSWNFITRQERDFIIRRVNRDRGDAVTEPFSLGAFLAPAADFKIWIFAFIFFCVTTVGYSINYFLPMILLGMVPPWVFTGLLMYAQAWLGDRYRLRGPIIAFNAILALVGLMLMAFHHAYPVRYTGVFFVVAGASGNTPPVLTYQANNIRGHWKRAFCSATLVGFGGIGGIAGALVFRSQDQPRYLPGIYASIACNVCILLCTGGLSIWFWLEAGYENWIPSSRLCHLAAQEVDSLSHSLIRSRQGFSYGADDGLGAEMSETAEQTSNTIGFLA
ncbi:phthalate transporter, putative [Metarhizium acridum CQMa 102]|uniref:Phthalate transporter, putative n=1 Tax=Metarhizium acridum (strain CQMa 102) TaxID=655827 RepID=E9E6Z9_METAQ|nr:phthalate transporter, putative [Metarhizium acridum CQMa 102]EFY88294.1 phthalate transporter, putative [Metarhizium acridum CQMa 102]